MIRPAFTFRTAYALGLLSACTPTERSLGDLAQPTSDAGGSSASGGNSPDGSGGQSAEGGSAGSGGAGGASTGDGSAMMGESEGGNPADGGATACGAGMFAKGETVCTAFTKCTAGEYVKVEGTATSDRECAACDTGSFSTTENAPSCTPWTTCAGGAVEDDAGGSTSDRTCKTDLLWVRQFGTPNDDSARSITMDSSGDIYVAGIVGGEQLGGPAPAGGSYDAFVRKFEPTGHMAWSSAFGSSDSDAANSVATDGSGNVYVAGVAGAALPNQTAQGASDVFLRKYDSSGNELWTRQFGSSGYDSGGVSVDTAGNAYVVGLTQGVLSNENDAGVDVGSAGFVFVRKYDASGTDLWTRQFGVSDNMSDADITPQFFTTASAVDPSGNLYVAGTTTGTLPGQTNAGGEDVFLRKYDGSGTELWTRLFGTSGNDGGSTVGADKDGNVYVAGRTFGAFPGQTNAGGADAYVRKYDGTGTEMWTRQFGTATPDIATAVAVDGTGTVYVGGSTGGTSPSQTSTDIFVRKFDGDGTDLGARQFGTTGIEQDVGLCVGSGVLYVAGETNGAFAPNVGSFDAFLAKLAP